MPEQPVPLEPADAGIAPEYRGGRSIKLAYMTAGVSKVATAGMQMLALPLAARDLGADRFGALMVLVVLTTFWCQIAQGVSPAASIMIARARGNGEDVRETFWGFAALSLLLALIAGSLSLVTGLLLPLMLVFGRDSLAFASEARAGLVVVSLYCTGYCFFWWSEGANAGFLRNHVTNLFTIACSVFILIGVAALAFLHGSLWAYFAVIFVSRPVAFGLNLVWLYWTHREVLGRPAFHRRHVRAAAVRSASFTVGLFGVNLQLQGSVYLVAHIVGLEASALAGGVIRIFALVYSTVLSIVTPIIPTISMAIAKGDFHWARKSALTIVAIGVVSGAGLFLSLGLFGQEIMDLWLDIAVPADRVLYVCYGAMGLSYILASLLYLLLSTLHETRKASATLLICGVASTGAGVLLSPWLGVAGIIAAHAIALIAAAVIPFMRRVFILIAPRHAPGVPFRGAGDA